MTNLPPEKPPAPPPLDYRAPPPKGGILSIGCLILSILLAVFVGGLCTLAFLVTASNSAGLAAILVVGIIILIGAAIFAVKKFGLSAAAAIAIVSICAFLLMLGVCSRVNFEL